VIHLAFTFTAGRYHGTPWGRHVNEGAVEWPPAPWRLYRALLATGCSRLGWTRPPAAFEALLQALAANPPTWWIPEQATTSHTRHYMPDGAVASADKNTGLHSRGTDLILDAFLAVPRDTPALVASFPVVLPDAERALLADLAAHLPYLGRAEAWVAAALVPQVPDGLVACAPSETTPGPGFERLDLLAPLTPSAFHDAVGAWRARAEALGKRSGKKVVPAFHVPGTLTEALATSTQQLQEEGWSEPPGSRKVAYWRHLQALTDRPRPAPTSPPDRATRPRFALLALASDTRQREVLPAAKDTLWQAETIHDALVSLASGPSSGSAPGSAGRGERAAPAVLTGLGPDRAPLSGHRHLHVLPLTLDRRAGRLDHVLLYAPMGLDRDAIASIMRFRNTWAKDLPRLFVTLVGLADAASELAGRIPEVGRSACWESRTPWVPPRHLKARGPHSLWGQVTAELASRGLPAPVAVAFACESLTAASDPDLAGDPRVWAEPELLPALAPAGAGGRGRVVTGRPSPEAAARAATLRLDAAFRHVRRARRDTEKAPPTTLGLRLRRTFAEPGEGPLCLGYGAHFGLGGFTPIAPVLRAGEDTQPVAQSDPV